MGFVSPWLEKFYSYVINGTFATSSLLILYFCIRGIVKNKVGKRVQYAIWMIILLRILLPKIPESKLSIYNYVPTYNQASTIYYMKDLQQPANVTYGRKRTEIHTHINNISSVKASILNMGNPVVSSTIYHSFMPIWEIGALVGLLVLISSYLQFYVNCKPIPISKGLNLMDILKDCKNELHIRQKIGLLTSNRITSPAVIGVIHPKIVLPPKMLSTLSSSELRFIFLHEMAHIKRKDIIINWITCLTAALHWFNPLIICAFKKMREDREICCDLFVLSHLEEEDVRPYGYTLVKALETSRNQLAFSTLASFSGDFAFLKGRFKAISSFKANAYRFSVISIFFLVFISSTCLTNAQTITPAYLGMPQPKDKFLKDSIQIYVLLKTRYEEERQFTKTDRETLQDFIKYSFQFSVIEKYPGASEFILLEDSTYGIIDECTYASKDHPKNSMNLKPMAEGYLQHLLVFLQQMMVEQ